MPETREEALQKTQELAERVLAVIVGEPHARGLDALIAVYKSVATRHECCTQTAADVCMQTAMQLAYLAADKRRTAQHDEQPAEPPVPPTHLH